MRDHVPCLERPLAGEALGKFIVKLMPEKNASEGRLLVRELIAAGTLDDHSVVIRRCVAIVSESESAATRAVGLAARAQGYGRATTPAASNDHRYKGFTISGSSIACCEERSAGEAREAAAAGKVRRKEITWQTARGHVVQGRNLHLPARR